MGSLLPLAFHEEGLAKGKSVTRDEKRDA
jgi:hypothetical protein